MYIWFHLSNHIAKGKKSSPSTSRRGPLATHVTWWRLFGVTPLAQGTNLGFKWTGFRRYTGYIGISSKLTFVSTIPNLSYWMLVGILWIVACNTNVTRSLSPAEVRDQHADLLVTHGNLKGVAKARGPRQLAQWVLKVEMRLLTELLKCSFKGSKEVSWHQQIYLTGIYRKLWLLPHKNRGLPSNCPFNFKDSRMAKKYWSLQAP